VPRICEFTGLADLDIYRARFLLIAAMDAHGCGALLRMGSPDG
jgi:hypothetical protein